MNINGSNNGHIFMRERFHNCLVEIIVRQIYILKMSKLLCPISKFLILIHCEKQLEYKLKKKIYSILLHVVKYSM